jgi:hypothetical protein
MASSLCFGAFCDPMFFGFPLTVISQGASFCSSFKATQPELPISSDLRQQASATFGDVNF